MRSRNEADEPLELALVLVVLPAGGRIELLLVPLGGGVGKRTRLLLEPLPGAESLLDAAYGLLEAEEEDEAS